MWCFLGKYARRKSLKPDLFREAVTKQRPAKIDVTHPATPISTSCDPPSPLLQLNSKSQPELANGPTSPALEEVEEDVLKAKERPSWEDVEKEALGAVASTDAHNVGPGDEPEVQDVLAKSLVIEIASSAISEESLPLSEVAAAQSAPEEAFETSQEPPVEAAEITICLPEEIRTPSPRYRKASTPPSSKRVVSITTREIPPPEHGSIHKANIVRPAFENGTPQPEKADSPNAAFGQEHTADDHQSSDVSISDPNAHSIAQQAPLTPNEEDDAASPLDGLSQSNEQTTIVGQIASTTSFEGARDNSVHPSMASEIVSPTKQLESSNVIPQKSESNGPHNSTESAVDLSQPIDDENTSTIIPAKTTRSGARFSDDTNLLKEFLNRAQAKKLTRDISMPTSELSTISPPRSPRKILAECTSNSPSPRKTLNLAHRPGTPPGKQRLDAFTFDDADELGTEPMSCRRSTRIRLPAPPRLPADAPSFIPVRRADGTDPVVLQKSGAQELAVQTRANTRRNKGQSKPPNVALQHLTTETVEAIYTRAQANEKAKSVGWDERLVYYYQDSQDTGGAGAAVAEEGKVEKRPKVRRLRGLGAANGTPAPKKMADVSALGGTPAPKRRGRLR